MSTKFWVAKPLMAIDFYSVGDKYYGSQWGPSIVWLQSTDILRNTFKREEILTGLEQHEGE